MKNSIGLEKLAPYLLKTHIKLDLDFLNKLLIGASKSDRPHRNNDFAKKIGCPVNKVKKSAMTIYGWMKGYRTIPLSKLGVIVELSKYSWKDVEENLISIKAGIRKGEICPRFPIKVDEGLGSIIGHILGDGAIDKRGHYVFYSNSNIDLLKEFRLYMLDIFGIEPRIWVQEKRLFHEKTKWMKRIYTLNEVPRGHNVGLFYPKICVDFLYLICGRFAKGRNKIITKEIKDKSREFKKGFIRAFFDDEGSISFKSHTLRLYQDNPGILDSIKDMLYEFGIKSKVVRNYIKRDKLRYYFNITGYDGYAKFYKLIGCTSPKKNKEFILLIEKVKNSRKFKNKVFFDSPASNNSNTRA